MNSRTILIDLHEMDGIGWKTMLTLVGKIPELTEIIHMKSNELLALGIPNDKAEIICKQLDPVRMEDKLQTYKRSGITVVTVFDENFPSLLKQCSQPPWVMYAKGDLSLMQTPAVAVVGTRNPTVYGKKIAEELAYGLIRGGMCVVSGMARGIDSEAHRGALRGQGQTIAVLGCGIDVAYPPENHSLYESITEKGLVLSEYPPGTQLHPAFFPMRNRIIAGLSLGTVVVEAAVKSGSLITADQALDESRDVFAVPGPVTSPKSQGALALLKQGAKIVTDAEDILQEYRHLLKPEKIAASEAAESAVELNEEERKICALLSYEPVSIDTLLMQSKTNFGHLHAILLSLLIKNRIAQLPGAAYVLI